MIKTVGARTQAHSHYDSELMCLVHATLTYYIDNEVLEMAKGYSEILGRRTTTMEHLRRVADNLCVLREELRKDLESKISKYPGVEKVDAMQAHTYPKECRV